MATSLAHGAIVPRLDAVRPAAASKESRRGHRLDRSTPASFSFKPPIIPTPHGNTIAWAPQTVTPHHLRAVVGAPRAMSRDRSGLITRARTDADRSGVGVGSGRRCSFRDGRRRSRSRLGSGRGGGPVGKGENTARASASEAEAGGGDGGEGGEGGGGGSGGGGGGSGGGGGDDEGDEEDAFKSLDEATAACEASGVKLPDDMRAVAEAEGLRSSVLDRFISMRKGSFLAALLFNAFPAVRDRALQDPAFMFKLCVEVFGDVALSVASEVNSRNTHFWDEAEFFVTDVLATVVLNATVLAMLSPSVTLGKSPGGRLGLKMAARVPGKLNEFLRLFGNALPANMPASAFAAAPAGVVFTPQMRALALGVQGIRIAALSTGVGLVGQGAANAVCDWRRKYAPEGYDEGYAAEVSAHGPPLVEPALEWGAFMGVSGNLRQQLVIGMERAIEGSSVGVKVPAIGRLASLCMRVGNNVWGGEQFARRMRAMEETVAARYGYYD